MINLEQVKEHIYNYYPKNIPYNSDLYKETNEFQRRKKKRNEALHDFELKRYLHDNIKKIFYNYYVDDWCDIIENNCYEFKILLHENQELIDNDIKLIKKLNNKRLDLFVFISYIEKYYYYFINLTEYYPITNSWKFKTVNLVTKSIEDKIKLLDKFFINESYIKLTESIAKSQVIDVETELHENGTATVFDCLFTELEHI